MTPQRGACFGGRCPRGPTRCLCAKPRAQGLAAAHALDASPEALQLSGTAKPDAKCSTPRWLHVHGTARHGVHGSARHGAAGSARTAGLAAVLRDLCPGAALRVHLRAHARACISVHARAPEGDGPDWRAHERLFGRSLPTYEWKETVGSISFSGHRSNSSPAGRATTLQPPNAPTDDELREDDLPEALGELQPAAPAAWVAA